MQKLINNFCKNNDTTAEVKNYFLNSNCQSSILIQNIFDEIVKDDNLNYNLNNLQEGVTEYVRNMKLLENSYGELSNKYLQKKYVKQRLRYHHYKSLEKIFKNLTTVFFSEKNYDENTIKNFEDEVISLFFSFFLILSIKDLKKKILNYRHNEEISQENNLDTECSDKYQKNHYKGDKFKSDDKKNLVDGSKYQLLSEFSRNIDSFFLIISYFFKEKINLTEGDREFNGHLILFLSAESYIEKKNGSRNIKKKSSYGTEFMLKNKSAGGYLDEVKEFVSFLNLNKYDSKIYETPPILYQNKYYSSSGVKLDEYFLVPTNTLNITNVVSSNSKYGCIDVEAQKTIKKPFTGEDSSLLSFIKNLANKKKKIDEDLFNEVVGHFINTKIMLKITIETPIEKIIELTSHYSESNSSSNKN